MRKRGATMVVLVACLAVFIGSVAPSAASSAGRIEGVVVQDENGQPLAGLCVFLTLANDSLVRHRTETASDGSYAFTGLASGDYKVGFTCTTTEQETWVPEYFNDKPWWWEADVLSVASGQTKIANVSIARSATVEGTTREVMLETAAIGPVPQLKLTKVASNVPVCMFIKTEIETFELRYSATSDDQGRYRIEGVHAADYLVGFGRACVSDSPYEPVYYGGATTSWEAPLLQVEPGMNYTVDAVVKRT